MKLSALAPGPDGVVTVIGPLVAPAGTIAVICVAELTVNDVAANPLNATAVAPVKPVPVTTTDVPTGPLPGAKPVIVGGGGTTVKLVALAAGPPAGVVTVIGPLVADRKSVV